MMNDSTRTAGADGEPGKFDVTTGEPGVDEALARIARLSELPDAGHVEAYEHVYQRLHGLLDELDTAAPGSPPADAGDPGSGDGQAEQA